MSDVLVLDGHHRSALTILRSLGSTSATTTVATTSPYHPGPLSKYADSTYRHEPLEDTPQQYVRDLKRHLSSHEYDAVIPVTDPTSLVCSKFKSELSEMGSPIGVEEWETFRRTYDKTETVELAQSLDVPTPETIAPDSVAEIGSLDNLPFPLVVKPRSKSRITESGISLDKVTETNYVADRSQLEQQFEAMAAAVSEPDQLPLLQECISGEIRDTSLLAEDGEIVAYVQNRRLRTYPRSGGGYTLVESLHSPAMREYAERLVAALDWTGPINFEFIYNGTTHYLIEINGRYWGSLALAVNCGIDIPQLHYEQLVGQDSSPLSFSSGWDYESGVRQRWLLPGDLLWLYETIEEGAWGDIPSFLTSFVTAAHDIPDLGDPLPTLGAVLRIAQLGYQVASGQRSMYGENQ